MNNIGIMRVVQRIVNELEGKNSYYQYLVVMFYAELMVLIYRYMDENYLPVCQNDALKKLYPLFVSIFIRTLVLMM